MPLTQVDPSLLKITKNYLANNFIEGYTTTATAAGTTTLTVNSTYQQFFTGSTTQTVLMPVVSTLVLGQQFIITNNSTGNVTVQSSGANLIVAMSRSTQLVVTCVLTSGTTAASWSASYSPLVGGASGGGAKNFVNAGDAEGGSIFATYKDAVQATPVDGAGGIPTIASASVTTVTPLSGTSSFLLTHPASNAQGEGWSIDFTIDAASKAKVLSLSFDYIINSGTFVPGIDLTVWIYDVTNAVLIQPSSFNFLSNSTTIADKFSATFQSASNSTSYRLIFHIASTAALAYVLEMDNISVSPSVCVYGSPVTDPATATFTLSNSGNATVTGTFNRLGSKGVFAGRITIGATLPTGAITLNLPVGYTMTSSANFKDGSITGVRSTTYVGVPFASTTTSITFFGPSTSGAWNATAPATWVAADYIDFTVIADVVGQSSSVQMSDKADTRVVAAKYKFTSAKTASVTQPYNFDTLVYDTHGSVTVSPTAWKFVPPIPGFYRFTITGASPGNSVSTNAFKNGSFLESLKTGTFTLNNGSDSASTTLQLLTTDYVDFRLDGTISGVASGMFAVEQVSGPSAIAASESVNASYYCSANFTSSPTIPINFDSKEFDSHGSVSTSPTAWKFKALISGTYQVGLLGFAGGTYAFRIYKNGTNYKNVGTVQAGVPSVTSPLIRLLADDYIDIRTSTSITVAGGALSADSIAMVSIIRVGN